MGRLIKKGSMKKTASSSTYFDFFTLDSGDIIALGCRLVNNKPWYQVYQESDYTTSSFYDGPEYEKALRMYKDLLTAFKGVKSNEQFSKSETVIKKQIDSLIEEDENERYNFQKLKSNPLFLGVNDYEY